MFAILRLLSAVVSLFIGWGLASGFVCGSAWYLWQLLADEALVAQFIAAPPPAEVLLLAVLAVPGALIVFSLLAFAFMSPGWLLSTLVHDAVTERLVPDHLLSHEVATLSRQVGLSSSPALFVYPGGAVHAFSVSTLNGSLIAFSLGMGQTLSTDEMRWVLAHQLVQIKSLNTLAGAFWTATEQLVVAAWRVHSTLVNLSARISRNAYSYAPLLMLALLPVVAVSYCVIGADRVSRFVFRSFDRLVGRAMERRADVQASHLAGFRAGVSALELVRDGLEPRFALFARTPVTRGRLERLHLLAEDTGESMAPTPPAGTASV